MAMLLSLRARCYSRPMWTAHSLAVVLIAAQPAPDAYVRVGCPFVPVAFEFGSAEMSEVGRQMLLQTARNLASPDRTPPQVILRTYTTEPYAQELRPLQDARADAVRQVLIETGFAPDHVLITHESGEGSWPVPENWRGGLVYTEYYITRAELERTRPRDDSVC